MKMYCIVDNIDTELGLKLSGCDGVTLDDDKDINNKIDEVLLNSQVGVLVVSKSIYKKEKEKLDNIRLNKKLPLITII